MGCVYQNVPVTDNSKVLNVSNDLSDSQTHRSTPKSRPVSTLDPELMLHPEGLPRASAVAMTKEYSFLRTSVPRGPKVGSLGIPPAKERKSKSSRSNKIHSLADYKTPETSGGGGGGGGGGSSGSVEVSSSGGAADSSFGSSHSVTSVSTLSEVSLSSAEMTESRLESPAAAVRDNASEVDGSESGTRHDGNDSDSSSYSSVSTTGTFATLAAVVGRQRAPYTVEGREIAPEAVGQYPSLHDVLQAATQEQLQQQSGDLEQEQEGSIEPRSRRDSFSSRYSTWAPRPSPSPPLFETLCWRSARD